MLSSFRIKFFLLLARNSIHWHTSSVIYRHLGSGVLRLKNLSRQCMSVPLLWFAMLMKHYAASMKLFWTKSTGEFPHDAHYKTSLMAPFFCILHTAASNPGAHRNSVKLLHLADREHLNASKVEWWFPSSIPLNSCSKNKVIAGSSELRNPLPCNLVDEVDVTSKDPCYYELSS